MASAFQFLDLGAGCAGGSLPGAKAVADRHHPLASIRLQPLNSWQLTDDHDADFPSQRYETPATTAPVTINESPLITSTPVVAAQPLRTFLAPNSTNPCCASQRFNGNPFCLFHYSFKAASFPVYPFADLFEQTQKTTRPAIKWPLPFLFAISKHQPPVSKHQRPLWPLKKNISLDIALLMSIQPKPLVVSTPSCQMQVCQLNISRTFFYYNPYFNSFYP